MPKSEFPESVNTEYLIMGVTSHLSIERETLMERAGSIIEKHQPEEITKSAALIMAALNLAHESGYERGQSVMEQEIRASIRQAKSSRNQ